MAHPHLMRIYCTGPNEGCIGLKAAIMTDLDINILTPHGHRDLANFPIREGGEFSVQASTEDVFTVRNCVHLHIWTDESTRLELVIFYIPTDDSPILQTPPDVHVILGRNSILAAKELGGRLPSIAPLRLGRESQSQAEERERTRDSRRQQAAKVQEARIEREAQQSKAEEEKRRQARRS
ncbi:hypothetical protein BO94DRAFT_358691 [Aspergillus sclerotioniger CBS 115572]|uniref:Uncharacterized protein n=1 Tax=Aspergillus sclerotioniger CBS 115572 TaxID=1450535 RepID=A0A317X349_9EURO|nr:hypothetical protein BO94DRAFT_358691 [Aspergillus sclerotioniger CBS 115572]PWY93054.1 hypothetical protein BO94DRAFT_358691 [Aspergillus sclerotioniger CBS 115572]